MGFVCTLYAQSLTTTLFHQSKYKSNNISYFDIKVSNLESLLCSLGSLSFRFCICMFFPTNIPWKTPHTTAPEGWQTHFQGTVVKAMKIRASTLFV